MENFQFSDKSMHRFFSGENITSKILKLTLKIAKAQKTKTIFDEFIFKPDCFNFYLILSTNIASFLYRSVDLNLRESPVFLQHLKISTLKNISNSHKFLMLTMSNYVYIANYILFLHLQTTNTLDDGFISLTLNINSMSNKKPL